MEQESSLRAPLPINIISCSLGRLPTSLPTGSGLAYILSLTTSGTFLLGRSLGILLAELALSFHSAQPLCSHLSCDTSKCHLLGIYWGAVLVTQTRDKVQCVTWLPFARLSL